MRFNMRVIHILTLLAHVFAPAAHAARACKPARSLICLT